MAVVKIGQVKKTLATAMEYICNPEKTRDMELVSTNMHVDSKDPLEFANLMLDQQEEIGNGRDGRGDHIKAHHIIQSFNPEDNITPEQAHMIGEELMQRLTGGDQFYVIATHVDKHHIHNHILLSPVVMSTRKRMRVNKSTLKKIRSISDDLCREHGLSVIRTSKTKQYEKTTGDFYSQVKGESIKEDMRLRIDQAASMTTTFDDFKDYLKDQKIEVTVRGKYLTFKDEKSGLRVRDTKLGAAYDESNIMAKLGGSNVREISFNTSMILSGTGKTVKVWVPGTRRRLVLTIPRSRTVTDRNTIRAWLPADSVQVLSDKWGKFEKQIPVDALYEYFAPPRLDIAKLIRSDWPDIYATDAATRKRLMAQAYRMNEINNLTRRINVTREYLVDGGLTTDQAIDMLEDRIREEQDELQSLIVASSETDNDEPLGTQISRIEDEISHLAKDVKALQQNARGQSQSEKRTRTRRNGFTR